MKHFFIFLTLGLGFGCATTTDLSTDQRWSKALASLPLTQRNLHSLLVADREGLAAEWYHDGWDTSLSSGGGLISWWSPQGPEVVHDVRSTTKSVVALLAGTVLARHPDRSLATQVGDFPELAGKASSEGQKTTLEDLLGMALVWKEWGHPWLDSDETALVVAADPLGHVLGRTLEGVPGQTFRYSGGNTQVAARMLELIDGRPLDEIARSWTGDSGGERPSSRPGGSTGSRPHGSRPPRICSTSTTAEPGTVWAGGPEV